MSKEAPAVGYDKEKLSQQIQMQTLLDGLLELANIEGPQRRLSQLFPVLAQNRKSYEEERKKEEVLDNKQKHRSNTFHL